MTFSILVRDRDSGAFGGAAATGSLCVGGWVLRGDSRAGLSASQGAAPSHLWGEDVLEGMRGGASAESAITRVTEADAGRDWRQLSALGCNGPGAAFTGAHNTGWKGDRADGDLVLAGNMLVGAKVLAALHDGFITSAGALPDRLLAALRAADQAGGDFRGLQSAALLVVSDDAAPLTLRVDWSERPIDALAALLAQTRQPGYAEWLPCVPTRRSPERRPDCPPGAAQGADPARR